jgi:predicted Zn-dependent protease with MMP-like domain
MLRDSLATESIYGFAHTSRQADVQPEEPIFVLTGSQLQDLVARAILPLQAELQDFKDTVALQGEKLADLEATQDLHVENQFIQLKLIKGLQDATKKQPELTKDAPTHIEYLYRLCIMDKARWFSIAEAAFALKISKETIRKLKNPILADGRFEMGWAESPGMRGHKGIVFKIRQLIK